MSRNSEIAVIFYEIADILEMQNIAWKPRAYRQAAQTIESLKKDVGEIYRKGGLEKLEELPNIGEALAKKIVEYIKTGKINEYQNLLKGVPSHIIQLMKIPGLGPRKIEKLNKTLGIKTAVQLEKAAKAHKIAKLPMFGLKSEKDILEAIELSRHEKGRISLEEAKKQAEGLINPLKKSKLADKIIAAGSVRRKKAFVMDIDILATSKNPEKLIDAFTKLPPVKKILAKGRTKAMVILKSGTQADILVLKPESWGAGLYYFTGNRNYNIMIRKIAIKKGFKLNEYGLFDKKTNKMIAGKTEEEIVKKLGLKLPKPEKREM